MILLTRFGLVFLLVLWRGTAPGYLGASDCTNPVAAVPTTAWHTMPAPKEDVEVVYMVPEGWTGLNHIYASRVVLRHTMRTLFPWTMPQINIVFPFTHSLETPANDLPLFYVGHSEAAAYIADSGPREIHLVRFITQGKDRELKATSGVFAPRFDPSLSSRLDIPVRVNTLSSSVFTIQPERRLQDGEYVLIFGPVAASGFEFGIHCQGEATPSLPRINADSK